MSTPSATPIRVLLIDDSPIIRLGLRSALEDSAVLAIVAEAGNAADGIRAARTARAEVVLLDLHLPDKSGVEVCRALRQEHPGMQIVMLSSDSSERNVQAARQAGAIGYLLKENDGATLTAAIVAAFNGEAVLDRSLSAARAQNESSHASSWKRKDPLDLLSQQERKVVALLSGGLTNREIGEQLGLTEKTVKNYLSAIFTKLNITRRTQAAALHVESRQER